MKEVIKYLERLKTNIELIATLRRQHSFLLRIVEENSLLTRERIRQFKNIDDKVSDIIVDEKFINNQ